ncbi:hypothetical protein [Mycobacterium sp. AZCC_0083]|nr:hypothetical protein [Mycobacterium sp. AZCC_0083]MBB5167098.1 hypothetical protein [Mycobacterium sp. AZCC_0083]
MTDAEVVEALYVNALLEAIEAEQARLLLLQVIYQQRMVELAQALRYR